MLRLGGILFVTEFNLPRRKLPPLADNILRAVIF